MRQWGISFKVEQSGGIMVIIATASSLAEKTRGSTTVGSSRICSNKRSRKNKWDNGMPELAGRVCTM